MRRQVRISTTEKITTEVAIDSSEHVLQGQKTHMLARSVAAAATQIWLETAAGRAAVEVAAAAVQTAILLAGAAVVPAAAAAVVAAR